MPFFSVIMPAYNSAQYLREAVESVLSQSETDFELIIMDDGSVDETYEIADAMAKQDARVTVRKLDHAGVSNARNCGIEIARGGYILFMDADDTWQHDLLEKCRENCREDDLTVFGIREDFYKGNQLLRSVNSAQSLEKEVQHLPFQINMLSAYNFASPCNKVYDRSVIQKHNIRFSTDCVYLEDLKFNIDYLHYTENVCILNEDLYFYRLSAEGGQIKKRRFAVPFINADAIYASFESYSAKKLKTECCKNPLINSILTNAYLAEAASWIDGGKQDLIKELNRNGNFRRLLRYSPRKRDFLLRLCAAFHLKGFETKMIKRGFENG